MPKRHVLRHIKPEFTGREGKPLVRFEFLAVSTSQLKGPAFRCDGFEDDELAEEVAYRCKTHWLGHLCFLFTADRTFYDVAKQAMKQSPLIIRFVPLYRKDANPRRKVIKRLKQNLIPFLRGAFHRFREDNEKAIRHYRRQAFEKGKQPQLD